MTLNPIIDKKMSKGYVLCLISMLFFGNSFGQSYPNNEQGQYQDMLTPIYYNSPEGDEFRTEVNKFIHFVRQIPFQHPLEDSLGQAPIYTIKRGFGDGIGFGGVGSHHPALDYHVGNSATLVNLYAAHDGYVSVDKTVSRYRHYLSITSEIRDSIGNAIGKMLTLYGHVDLDLDSMSDLNLNGKYVQKGDLISKHLYSGTVGGPHLHFEIRYYRNSDLGTEDFYGGNVGDKTTPSAGKWTYGYWNPDKGYGYANPLNHLTPGATSVSENIILNSFKIYPNPTKGLIIVKFENPVESTLVTILNTSGQVVYKQEFRNRDIIKINFENFERGIYFMKVDNKEQNSIKKFMKI